MSEVSVPEGWRREKLGDIANIIMGQSPLSSTYNTEKNGLPFFQGKADFGSRNPTIKIWCSEPTKIAPENSILFSVRAPVGDVNISLWQCCIGRGLSSITGIKVNQEFLYQRIQFDKRLFQLMAQGSTFEAVNGSEMKAFELPIPPLPEQQKIASILTSVDDVIEKTQSQINKLQDLKKGTMNELLTRGIGHTEFKDSPVGRIPRGWEVTILSKKTDVIDSLHQTPSFSNSGFPMVRVTDIKTGKLKLDQTNKVSEDVFQEFVKKYKPTVGDIVMSRVGSYGISSYVETNQSFCIGQNTVVINPKTVNSQYAYYWLNSLFIKNHIENEVAGSGYKSLSLKSIRELPLLFPSNEEQQKIASILSSIDKTIEEKQRKLQQTKFLKKSLMNDLLTGKVRVSV